MNKYSAIQGCYVNRGISHNHPHSGGNTPKVLPSKLIRCLATVFLICFTNYMLSAQPSLITSGLTTSGGHEIASVSLDFAVGQTFDAAISGDKVQAGEGILHYFPQVSVSAVKEQLGGVTVFPNPTASYIYVDLPSSAASVFKLFDLQGRTVWEHNYHEASIEINLDSMVPGMYLLIISQDGRTKIQKVSII